LVLGKHSGRHALRDRVEQRGCQLSDVEFEKLFEDFKALADKKKEIYDADIDALIEDRVQQTTALWEIESLHISTATGALPTASVSLRNADGQRYQEAACGDGPIDALYKAIERVTGVSLALKNYEVRSVTVGEDAMGEVAVEVEQAGFTHRGVFSSTDIIEASARAFLQVVNRVALKKSTADEPAAVVNGRGV